MKCFSLLLGARNTPKGGKAFSSADDALIREITFRHFAEGFTVLNADGGWFDPKGKRFVAEESRQILVCAPRWSALQPWCRELVAALGQKEVLVVELGPARTFALGQKSLHQVGPPAAAQEPSRKTIRRGRA